MKLYLVPTMMFSALAAALASSSVIAQTTQDWAQSSDPLVVAPSPRSLAAQVQNPPTFTWSRHSSNPPSYIIEVRQGQTLYKTFTATRNWYLPSVRFPVGSYTWRVRPSTLATWSADFPLVIDANSQGFAVPENADLRAAILKIPRPRGLQRGLPLFSSWSAPMRLERGTALSKMREEVLWVVTKLALPRDADWTLVTGNVLTAANAAQTSAIRASIFANGRQLEAAALLYRLTGETQFLTEALRRGDQLAALNPDGPTSFTNQDQGTRVIALSLIKSVDSLGSALDATRRAAWLKSVERRSNAIYADLAGDNGRMDQYPLDSHGGTNQGYLALIATLALGDIPAATTWFDFSFRSYVASFSAWSGPEGGFANGTAYAQYTADVAQEIWQPLAQATGIDMFNKPWSIGFLRFFMHFVPPNAERHVFGDENEVVPSYNVLKGYAAHFALPAAAWYFKALPVAMDPLTLLQAPFPLPVSTVATTAAPANAALYPSIGWAAMHSNIADASRTSLYFKSSPYGSYNHSHAEQNSFVLMKGGTPLLAQSGYSDYYGSPLWSSWYRQTKAHNAITYDGGIGQSTDGYSTQGFNKTKLNNGAVTSFKAGDTSNNQVDFVEGDARAAYNGVLTTAGRKIWYLRDVDTVVVLDTLEAPLPHVFEWNFHAFAPIVVNADGSTSVTYKTRSVCIAPMSKGVTFAKRVGPPPKTGVEDHGVYANKVAATKAEFLTVLDIGCKNAAPQMTLVNGSRAIKVTTKAGVLRTLSLPN